MLKRIGFLLVVISMILSMISCSASSNKSEGSWIGGGSSSNSGGPSVENSGGSMDSGDPDYEGGYMPPKGEAMAPDAVGPEGGVDYDDALGDSMEGDSGEDVGGEVVKPDEVVLPGGMITAGAWVDNDNYQDWLALFTQNADGNGKFYNYTNPDYSWGFNSLNRVKVNVKNGDNAVAGATVIASDSKGNPLYVAVTDAQGNAYLFVDEEEGTINVTSGDGKATVEFTKDSRDLTVSLDSNAEKLNVIEIMLLVDVTGSMGDEIYFLKAELADVINRISQNNSGAIIKLSMLFYRDNDDSVPFDYYDFEDVTTSTGLNKQQSALNKQYATGGGDYPEAVDEALLMAVNKQWSTGATTKIIFHVLDAPAHEGEKYAERLVNATKIAAEKGIRVCPIICSGAADSTEYTMREVAIHTGGTFIFVTDDSGIGGSHHDPVLPNVTVELLNSLMVRLVNGYHTGEFSDPIFWKQDPNLNNQ